VIVPDSRSELNSTNTKPGSWTHRNVSPKRTGSARRKLRWTIRLPAVAIVNRPCPDALHNLLGSDPTHSIASVESNARPCPRSCR
jgi:hypothetical protein